MLKPKRERIEKALCLFREGDQEHPDTVSTVFDCLGAEINVRTLVASQLTSPPANLPFQPELSRLFTNTSLRLSDFMMRLGLIEVVRSHFAGLSREEALAWHSYGALCIKDFHIDLGSLMDSVAPVVIKACGSPKLKSTSKLPGFSDIKRDGDKRAASLRPSLPEDVLALIDATDEWWPSVKAIRDMLAHREHQKAAFGRPADGVLFQVFAPTLSPRVVHPAFLWPQGNNVADFRRYSAYVIAEVLLFLDELGAAMTKHLHLSQASLTPGYRSGYFIDVVSPLREMLESKDL